MNFSRLKIMNMALGELPARTIPAETERSIAAESCVRWYDVVVGEMVETIKPDFALTREALALEVTNGRSLEWSYAYALPSNCAYPLAIRLAQEAATGYELLVGQSLPGMNNAYGQSMPPIPYSHAEGVIYSDEPTAVLEYIRDDVSVADFTPSFAKAVSLELAARICLPVIKDKVRHRELITASEVATQRAIAANQNRQLQSYDFVPENVMARAGVL